MDSIKFQKGNVRVIAHRGLSGIETENTAAAFLAAGNRSYYGIETDIRKTRDGQYVCMHDDDTGRISSQKLAPAECSYDELTRAYYNDRTGGRPRRDLVCPLLSDYISICKRYGKQAIAELKLDYSEKELGEIFDIISREGYLDGTTFISFHPYALLRARKLLPKQPMQLLADRVNEEIIEALVKYEMGIDFYYPALTENDLKWLKSHNIAVNCWTVDSKEDGERLAKWGVDFITTNILE